MTVIDIHTHMFGDGWLRMLKQHGSPTYACERLVDERDYLMEHGAAACAFEAEAFDYDLRIKGMDQHGIDLAIVSLTSPNVFWGSAEVSADTAKLTNDEMAAGQTAYPERIRFFASIPWQYPQQALVELQRALALGAVGVMAIANVNGRHLIDPMFEPLWQELDRLGLPVLVHPTAPFGAKDAQFGIERILMPGLGFMYDTTLAVARMAIDGFFDRYPKVKIIAAHAGGYLPYVADRIDVFFEAETLIEAKISQRPSSYYERLYFDSIVYHPQALALCMQLAGPHSIMFGTDYPMPANIPKLLDIAESFPANESAAIKSGNATRVFKL